MLANSETNIDIAFATLGNLNRIRSWKINTRDTSISRKKIVEERRYFFTRFHEQLIYEMENIRFFQIKLVETQIGR